MTYCKVPIFWLVDGKINADYVRCKICGEEVEREDIRWHYRRKHKAVMSKLREIKKFYCKHS